MENTVIQPIQGAASQQALETLLNQAFQVPLGSSYFLDFPIWKEEFQISVLRLGAFDVQSNQLISAAGIRKAILKDPSRSTGIPVGLVGAVATHPSWRGQGLASHLVENLISWAKNEGLHSVFLWGSEHKFYQRLGFKLDGFQLRISLDDVFQGVDVDLSTRIEIYPGWTPELFSLLKTRRFGLELFDADIHWIQAHRHVDWWWCGSPEKPLAYAAVNRGIDLTNIIHEWGGERWALLKLLHAMNGAHHQKFTNSTSAPLFLIGSQGLFQEFEIPLRSAIPESLCLIKPLQVPLSKVQMRSLWFWGLDSC